VADVDEDDPVTRLGNGGALPGANGVPQSRQNLAAASSAAAAPHLAHRSCCAWPLYPSLERLTVLEATDGGAEEVGTGGGRR
jgi:hypothetical protein